MGLTRCLQAGPHSTRATQVGYVRASLRLRFPPGPVPALLGHRCAGCGAEDWGKGTRRRQARVLGPAVRGSACQPSQLRFSPAQEATGDKGPRPAAGGGIPPAALGAVLGETVWWRAPGGPREIRRDSHQRSRKPVFPLRVVWLNRGPLRAPASKGREIEVIPRLPPTAGKLGLRANPFTPGSKSVELICTLHCCSEGSFKST